MLSLSHHSPCCMKKHLDQTRSYVSFSPGFPKNHWNHFYEWCGNDGSVALHIQRSLLEAQCQRWFVHKVDGLHLTGWLVYLTARAANFLFLLPFWHCKVFFASSSKISDAHYLWILLTCQLFHLTPAMFLLFSKPCLYPPWQDIETHSTAIKRAKHISGRITKNHGVKLNFSKHGILTA